MKVAIFTGTYVENKDGVARSLYELVRSLRNNEHEVGIWTPEFTPSSDPGITFHEIPSIPIPLYPEYRMTIYLKNILKELDRFGPDIIQISTPDLIALKFLKYSKDAGIPIVSIYHTDFPSYLKYFKLQLFEGTVWKEMIRFYNKCDAVFAPTLEMKEQLESKGTRKVEIWSRGVRKDEFSPEKRSHELRSLWGADGRKVVLFSGRFVKYKDLDVVMDVYRKVKKNRRNDLLFVLLGKGPMEEELKKEMPEAIFPGYLTGEDLFESYASADIFLFPSTTETFGNVVQEAISSGLPSIVSDTGGCKEIVSESMGGLICRGHKANDFYDALMTLTYDPDLYSRLKDNGSRWAMLRTWEHINGVLIEKFQEMIERKKNKRETP
ncbi:MAG: glycosyltransferase family 1 protein [Candidatus Thermoplasmatota archaeon]|nr:glycosyltransferase family 1 protein [Candidatus Thermoplasmatota archaeon]